MKKIASYTLLLLQSVLILALYAFGSRYKDSAIISYYIPIWGTLLLGLLLGWMVVRLNKLKPIYFFWICLFVVVNQFLFLTIAVNIWGE